MGQANIVYFTKSLELRAKALQMMRHARGLPVGPERSELRRIARALKALSDNEAWLRGEVELKARQASRPHVPPVANPVGLERHA